MHTYGYQGKIAKNQITELWNVESITFEIRYKIDYQLILFDIVLEFLASAVGQAKF